jgi:hypothetical protein
MGEMRLKVLLMGEMNPKVLLEGSASGEEIGVLRMVERRL